MKRTRIKTNCVKIMSVSGRKITRLATMLVFGVVMMSCDAKSGDYPAKMVAQTDTMTWSVQYYEPLHAYSVEHDDDSVQISVCKALLNECAECGILDANGIKAFNGIKANPSVNRYMELIDECEQEENFGDTVAEGDAWCDYLQLVIEPRVQLCND